MSEHVSASDATIDAYESLHEHSTRQPDVMKLALAGSGLILNTCFRATSRGTPKGCKKISRWLASEASVTTGEFVSKLLAPSRGARTLHVYLGVSPLRGFNPW
jgi:hypothetical protein